DYMTGDDGNDLLFDGEISVTYPSHAGSSASLTIGDANDLAMQDLLNDWKLDSALSLLLGTTLQLASNVDPDTILGGMGTDTSFSGGGTDNSDAEYKF